MDLGDLLRACHSRWLCAEMDLPTRKRKLVDGANDEFKRAVLVAVLGEDHETHVAWLEEVSPRLC